MSNPHNYETSWTIEQHRDELIERLGEAIRQLAQQAATISELREAMDGFMQLVDNGVLVRDTSRDGETGWALHQLPLLCTLQKAHAVLAKMPKEKTT